MDGIPNKPEVLITRQQKKELRGPWRKTLIVKLQGKTIGQDLLTGLMKKVWRTMGDFEVLELGNGFSLVKFESLEDCSNVLTGGPRMIFNHYLTVQRGRPDFQTSLVEISYISIWLRLLELHIEYCDEDVLNQVGIIIGKPIRLDDNTTLATETEYAHLCVEVDFQQSLVSKISIGKITQLVEYEGIHAICFKYGKAGHREEACGLRPWENQSTKEDDTDDAKQEVAHGLTGEDKFGP
ncbi:DUF4283 domain-containing protein [Cephalotus follicularis]|uniref:DUF4283 domain-containing protein n=1 Tax=Cephalotus follicularis TaxID=3775 RepID=A0A1Q3DF70_CEPFO|nr:DUF4283 domain-containing protein [Cephalotus follicularis]